MKFSYNWLCELVDGVAVTPKDLGDLITMKTAECEGIEPYGAHFSEVCAALVTKVEPVPGSKLRKATVETKRYGIRTVVCGAPNCREGMTTAYVPPGVTLDGKEIRKAEIRGVLSDGMLASGAELGINRDAAGILDFEAEPGDPVPGCEPDHIIEIDNKSLTHRPDLWGHFGMAREVAAILRLPLKDPVDISLLPGGDADVAVEIKDYDVCPRYSALTFDNVTVGPSPIWMPYRLESIGLNAISNTVDVTNYILSEISEPMHAFDRDALSGDTVYARRAREGEFITALNEVTYKLTPADCIIADAKGPVAIGGVMGGLDSRVLDSTSRIVLESANFHATTIRKTSSRLKLRTDASQRFEKAQDPKNTVRGLARAVDLLRQVSPGIKVIGGLADDMTEIPVPPEIALHTDWLARKLGRRVPTEEVTQILTSLEFGVEAVSEKTLAVTVPSWRATRDVSIKDDLVEEVGRMVGYDSIALEAPEIPSTVPPPNEERALHHDLRTLVADQGFTEIYNYSFHSDEMAVELGLNPEDHVKVINPIASDQGLMRLSLIPGILRNVRSNARHSAGFRLFEIGYEIHRNTDDPAKLPHEIDHLTAAVYAREGDGAPGLFELKRLAECILPGCEVAPAESRSYEHPSRTHIVTWRDQELGRIFEFHPGYVEGRAAVLDVNIESLRALGPLPKKYEPLHRFPSSAFDLSVIAPLRELSGNIEKRLKKLAGESLESIEFLRRYTGAPLAGDQQSLSYRLTVYARDHTLTAGERSAIRDRIIAGMKAAGYELRL